MGVRIHCPLALTAGATLALPPEAARHVQVLRLQPGEAITVFNGEGGEWLAVVLRMGRHDVDIQVGDFLDVHRELPCAVTLAVGMPANERMDALVEKATELGAAVIVPLLCTRSVLRLSGERADKRRRHWEGVAVAAAEQSGRTAVPRIEAVQSLPHWLGALPRAMPDAPASSESRQLLSFAPDALGLQQWAPTCARMLFLSGPEGGLDAAEEAAARAAGFKPLSLGPRVLRADTAPLAALAALAAFCGSAGQPAHG